METFKMKWADASVKLSTLFFHFECLPNYIFMIYTIKSKLVKTTLLKAKSIRFQN